MDKRLQSVRAQLNVIWMDAEHPASDLAGVLLELVSVVEDLCSVPEIDCELED